MLNFRPKDTTKATNAEETIHTNNSDKINNEYIIFLYNVAGIKGRLVVLDGPISVQEQGNIRPTLDYQIAKRGAERGFTFKAIGHKWRFERIQ